MIKTRTRKKPARTRRDKIIPTSTSSSNQSSKSFTVIHLTIRFSLSNFFFFSWPDLAVPWCAPPETTDPLTTQPYKCADTQSLRRTLSCQLPLGTLSFHSESTTRFRRLNLERIFLNRVHAVGLKTMAKMVIHATTFCNLSDRVNEMGVRTSWSCSQPACIDAHVCLCLTELKRTG